VAAAAGESRLRGRVPEDGRIIMGASSPSSSNRSCLIAARRRKSDGVQLGVQLRAGEDGRSPR
jgi:hypothetical protein